MDGDSERTETSFSVDIRNLLSKFDKENTLLFADFKRLWKSLGFSIIHECKPKRLSETEFTLYLYNIVTGYMYVNRDVLNIRIGCLYALYLLYETQHNRPKVKITVSLAMWHEMLQLLQKIIELKLVEPYQIFHKLRRFRCFCYAALPPNIELVTEKPTTEGESATNVLSETNINIDTINGVLELDEIQSVADYYARTKLPDPSIPMGSAPLSIVNNNFAEELMNIVTQYNAEKMDRIQPQVLGLPEPDKRIQELARRKSQTSTSSRNSSATITNIVSSNTNGSLSRGRQTSKSTSPNPSPATRNEQQDASEQEEVPLRNSRKRSAESDTLRRSVRRK